MVCKSKCGFNKRISASLCLLLCFGSQAEAKRVALYMGGSGDPESSAKTVFDDNFKTGPAFLKKAKFDKVTTLFDGSHPASLKDVAKSIGTKPNSFTTKNINGALEELERGPYNDGDEILIVIDSHGDRQGDGEKTHSVSSEDGVWSLDRLELFQRRIKERFPGKKIKLGIIDFSCNSGGTQILADSDTCVVSSAADGEYGWTSFSSEVWRQASESFKTKKASSDLESVFVNAIEAEPSLHSTPLISTAASKRLRSLEAEFAQPNSVHLSKVSPSVFPRPRPGKLSCLPQDAFEDLRGYLRLDGTSIEKSYGFMLEGMRNYNQKLKETQEALKIINDLESRTVEINGIKLTYRELIKTDWEKELRRLEPEALNVPDLSKSEAIAPETLALLDDYQLAKALAREGGKERLKREHPEVSKYESAMRGYDQLYTELQSSAKEALRHRKEVFAGLYRQFSNSKDPNACSNFKLW